MTEFFYIGFYFLKQFSVFEVVCEEQIACPTSYIQAGHVIPAVYEGNDGVFSDWS
jgi:hypothetical protein